MPIPWDTIDNLVKARHLERPGATEESLVRYLQQWWCMKFNRPFKDPLLKEYTLPDLIYEFLYHYYQIPENDPKKLQEQEQRQSQEDEWIKTQLIKHVKKETKKKDNKPDKIPQELLDLPEINKTYE